MKGKMHLVAAALLVLALIYDLVLWGGLAKTPALGHLVTQGAQREVSLVGVYLPTGRLLVESTGLSGFASDFAAARFAPLEARLLANRAAAMDTLISDMPFSVRAPYYGAPILLLLTAFLWWRRPRGVHMVGPR